MDYTRARDELKAHLRDYVESITDKSQSGMYVCPLCHSGEGKNHTGAFGIVPEDPTRWKCFSCNEGGDIFDLIGKHEGIADHTEQLKRAAELYGIKLDQNQNKNERYTDMHIHTNTYTHTDTDKSIEEVERMKRYFLECQARISETDYHIKRGISPETAKRLMLGYDPHFKTGKEEWKALIIPTGAYNFTARNTNPITNDNNRYRRHGNATPFNGKIIERATKPVFIVEGEIDALSIIEAGGEAVGLGSTANINIFIRDFVKPIKPAQPLILALDQDEAGQAAEDKLAAELDKLGVTYYRLDPYNGYKDANEALQKDREAFIREITQAEHIEEELLEAERERYKQTSAGSHLQDFIDGITESANTPAQPTGFTALDKALDGGLYEGLYIIGAITSLGKTTLALQIADQIAQSGRDVLIFSLEMARTELMSKSISRNTLLEVMENGGDIRNAKTNRGITAGARYAGYSETERTLIKRAVQAYGEYAQHIYIHEGLGNIGAEQIRAEVAKHERITGEKPVVLIDYIQILAPNDIRATDKQNIDKAVLELKRISRDFKIPVIGISSLNRAGYAGEVTLADFKESGAIEYGSDVLIGLHFKGAGDKDFNITEEKRKDPREVELIILKNRNGSTGDRVDFDYYPLFNYFKERQAQPSAKRIRL